MLDAQVRPFAGLLLVLVGQWQARRIRLVACVRDAKTYDPFCGTDWWSEVQVGGGGEVLSVTAQTTDIADRPVSL